ncbi:hypothetical protein EON83_22960 [bacterium]|nr:MAG: hypothetical protein EON83_22960 [bacterium]
MQYLFSFLIGLVMTIGFGVASYCFGQWFRRVKPSWANNVDTGIAIVGSLVLFISLIFLVPLCLGAAYAARAREGNKHSVGKHFVQILSSSLLPALTFHILWIIYGFLNATPFDFTSLAPGFATATADTAICLGAGAILGITATAPAIEIFRWMWQNSQMRPGMDRALRPEEKQTNL